MLNDDEKSKLLEAFRQKLKTDLLPPCEFAEGLVFGEGRPETRLVLVGEAPGEQEERQGRPFVGRSGQLLRRTLEAAGISPEDVWITNVVKCRPTVVQAGRRSNRAPTWREAQAWLPHLMDELEILRPQAIICLGNLAARALIQKDFKMTEGRGKWHPGPFGSHVLATYHPSYVLRQIGPQAEVVRNQFRDDIAEAGRGRRAR